MYPTFLKPCRVDERNQMLSQLLQRLLSKPSSNNHGTASLGLLHFTYLQMVGVEATINNAVYARTRARGVILTDVSSKAKVSK